MDEANIRKYALLMKELELTGLEISQNGETVRLERTPAQQVNYGSAAVLETEKPAPKTKPEKETPNINKNETVITSPMVGIFYSASAENAEPFVKKDDFVKKGDVLCIIEAMKLMNEITAENSGVITEILVENGQLVEYGTPLFVIASK